MMVGRRLTPKSLATLRAIGTVPRDVRDLPGGQVYALVAHRAIDVKNGMAIITRAGVRQLRNAS